MICSLLIRFRFFNHTSTTNQNSTLNLQAKAIEIPLKLKTVKKDVAKFIQSVRGNETSISEYYLKDANAREAFAKQLFLEANYDATAEFYARVESMNQDKTRYQLYQDLQKLMRLERETCMHYII